MTTPDFALLMAPVLEVLVQDESLSLGEIRERLTARLNVDAEARSRHTGLDGKTAMEDHLEWALIHLGHARLVTRACNDVYQITDRGRAEASLKKARLEVKYLMKFPEYEIWRAAEGAVVQERRATSRLTPEERMLEAHLEMQHELEREALQMAREATPGKFEDLVLDLLVRMGYGRSMAEAAANLGKRGKGVLEGAIVRDPLGLERVYVRAGRGNDVTTEHLGICNAAAETARARHAVFMTTSSVSGACRDFAAEPSSRLVLVDGNALGRLMVELGVGVATHSVVKIQRLDRQYFAE